MSKDKKAIQRVSDIVGRVVNSGFVAPGVTALTALVATANGIPPAEAAIAGTAAGAFVGATAQELVDLGTQAWRDRAIRVAAFTADVAVDEQDLADLLEQASREPRLRDLLARAVEAAARSQSEQKIALLAKIYAGIRRNPDDSKIDTAVLVVDALGELEGPHVRLMVLLAGDPPPYTFGNGAGATGKLWARGNILHQDPKLTPSFTLLIARLQAIGFVEPDPENQADEPIWRLTEVGRAAISVLDSNAHPSTPVTEG